MIQQVLQKQWTDLSKSKALEVVFQYSTFLGIPIEKPKFRAYDNRETYVPSPSMVKQLLYRIKSLKLRSAILISIETGATRQEVWNLTWKDVNLQNRTITIHGVKGHRTTVYPMSEELLTLLMQLPRNEGRVIQKKAAKYLNHSLTDYRKRLAKETGNTDFDKIHWHTLRHYAISWKYFRCKDIIETQRFARHCNIQNTLKYVHIIKAWIKENEFDVVYAESKEELTKYLGEGCSLVTKTEWGYCLTKPKSIVEGWEKQ